MTRDSHDLELTTTTEAAALYDAAVRDYWGLTGDPVGKLKRALEIDPRFALAATAIAALFMVSGFPSSHVEVLGALAAARAGAPNARERAHLAAVEAWGAGRLYEAAHRWEAILADCPRDALALRLVQDAYYFLGEPQAIRDSLARAAPAWTRDDALYGFLLGARAFGLEETGELAAAEAAGLEAIALNPSDGWAAHALAHVYETHRRPEAGIEFLRRTRAHWTTAHFMAGHIGWHMALYQIAQHRFDAVIADYDKYGAPKLEGDATLDRVDAASLLWRLELEGVDVGDRWTPVAKAWMAHVDDHTLAFNDLHLAIAAARSPDPEDAARMRASLARFLDEARGDNRDTTAEVAAPLIEGLFAYSAGDYRAAINAIAPLTGRAIRIGGSHAQRDIVRLTLVAAAERAGDRGLAALGAERGR